VWIDGEYILILWTLYLLLLYLTGDTLLLSQVNPIDIPLFLAVKLHSVYLKLYEHFKSHLPETFLEDILIFWVLINITI
jgi:hypothetical protein